MPIAKAVCPECGAKLSSPDGFAVGEEVECPKCETEFKVRAPKSKVIDDEDYEDAPPKKKRKRRDDDDEEMSGYAKYRKSPLRFAILGVLILVMLVGAFFLVRKIMKERADNAAYHPVGASLARTASQTSAITLVAVA